MSREKDSEDDAQLFREAMEGTKPLENEGRVLHEKPRPAPIPRQRRRDERAVMDELLDPLPDELEPDLETGEELNFLRDGFPPRLLRQLRKGQYVVQAHLDLHHMTQPVAQQALLEFIADAQEMNLGCIRIVHGKGLRSRKGPVLKQLTYRLLRRHKTVVGFTSCPPADGGTGAVRVLLRQAKRQSHDF